MRRMFTGLLFLILVSSVLVSCGKRENPVRTVYPFSEPWKLREKKFVALENNVLRDPDVRTTYIYLPPQYDWEMHFPLQAGFGFPVLYLLHDFGGDNETFCNVYKVQQIADRLIANNEIQPMIIVMPDGSNYFGGSFYANSDLNGRYEDYIIKELMLIIDTTFHTVARKDPDTKEIMADRRYKAISGHGMGGYGAFKMALDYDTTRFQSVSGMSPFVSFGSFLTKEMIEEVFRENGIPEGDISHSSYKTINPWTDSDHPSKTITQLVFAMAAAFSPHDPKDTDPDDPYFFEILNVGGERYGVDLPFDSTRTIPPGSDVWDRWMSYHDITTLLGRRGTDGGFGELKMYLDCGDSDQLKLYEGARAFDRLLSQHGIEHTYVEYPGFANYPAGHSSFIYDRLPEILKFHSRNFPPPRYFGYEQ